jgi:hypothetical protein
VPLTPRNAILGTLHATEVAYPRLERGSRVDVKSGTVPSDAYTTLSIDKNAYQTKTSWDTKSCESSLLYARIRQRSSCVGWLRAHVSPVYLLRKVQVPCLDTSCSHARKERGYVSRNELCVHRYVELLAMQSAFSRLVSLHSSARRYKKRQAE